MTAKPDDVISDKDRGCEESPSCLACPLPWCKYDDAGRFNALRRAERDVEWAAVVVAAQPSAKRQNGYVSRLGRCTAA